MADAPVLATAPNEAQETACNAGLFCLFSGLESMIAQPGHAVEEDAHQLGLAAHPRLGKDGAQMGTGGIGFDTQGVSSLLQRHAVAQMRGHC